MLEVLCDVYRNDQVARERGMSPDERLVWHQAESAQSCFRAPRRSTLGMAHYPGDLTAARR